MTQAAEIRKQILKDRDALSSEERHEKSRLIGERLLELSAILTSESIFIYADFRSEVETTTIIDKLLRLGKQVSVPLTRVAERRLDIISITDPATQLIPGYCDIPEPREALVETNSLSPEQLDAIVLPGSVFDQRGGRFGYGGGFYDRLLAQIPDAHRIALAFDLQVIDRLPLQPHDQILDMVITESRTIRGHSR